jgi:8-oxo-dGTP diphosphatase
VLYTYTVEINKSGGIDAVAEKGHYVYDYPRPLVTVDAVVLTERQQHREVLLVRRKHDPFKGFWALPGGFIEMDERLEDSAKRELKEEAGISDVALEQFRTFGDPGRDPRGRTVSVAFVGTVDREEHSPQAADDASEVAWFPVDKLPRLAFDHNVIVECALGSRHLTISCRSNEEETQ